MAFITVNQADIARVQSLLGDLKDKYKSVMTTSINKTLTTVRTQATARIGNEINLKAARIKQDFYIYKANFSNISGAVGVVDEPVGLINFGANQTQKGVTVKVLRSSSRSLIKHAYIASRGGEHVYWRSTPRSKLPPAKKYMPGKKWNVAWRKMGARFWRPVERLTGPRVADIFAKDKVFDPVSIQAQYVYLQNVDAKIEDILRMHRG